MKKLYINTTDKNDVVTLDEIRKRYIGINETEEGFNEYVEGEFYNGMEQEYIPYN